MPQTLADAALRNRMGSDDRVRAIPRPRGTRLSVVLLTVALVALGRGADAQDLEPRAYVNTPVGLNFLLAGYGYMAGGVATDPSLPLQNADLQVHSALLAYSRALDVWGMSGKVDVVVPYAWLSGSADVMGQPREREVSGFADPRLRFSVNLYGAPALSLQEFAHYRQDLIIGASLQVSAPLGQYNPDKLVNIGTNRWSFKPEIGIGKALGPLRLELSIGVTLNTDNHDFFGGKTRAQAPIYSVQGHVSYDLGSGIWVAVDGTYYTGGRTTVDGVEGDDLQKNSRLSVTVALPVNRHTSVKLYGSTGVSTRTGSDFDAIGMVAGAAVASANTAAATSSAYSAGYAAGATTTAYAMGAIYATLPAGCAISTVYGTTYYHCGTMWFQPSYGANGVYYRVVPTP